MKNDTLKSSMRTICGLASLFLLIAALVWYTFESYQHTWSLSLLVSGLFLLAVYLVLQVGRYRTIVKRRSTRFGANMTLYVVVVVGILVTVNYLSEKHKWRWDITETGLHTLSPQSIKILAGLDREIEIIAFFNDSNAQGQKLQELLEQYHYQTEKITYRIVDPDRYPAETKALKAAPSMVVLKAGDREEKYFIDREPTENQLTNAIMKVTREGKKTVYFLTGHGEKDLDITASEGLSLLKESLENMNYDVEKLVLIQQSGVPSDASVVVVCGPEKPLLEKEEELLKEYVERGGRLMVQVDPDPAPGLDRFLVDFGVISGKGLVIDTVSQIFGVNYIYAAVMNYPEHPINEDFGYITLYPEARPLRFVDPLPERVLARPLATTSSSSWAEGGPIQGEVTFDPEQDEQGPVTLAVVITRSADSTMTGEAAADSVRKSETGQVEKQSSSPTKRTGMVLVFGDSDFITNKYALFQGNLSYYLNSVHYLAGENDLVAVSPKQFQNRTLMLTERQETIALWTVLFLPVLVVVIGFAVWLNRRG